MELYDAIFRRKSIRKYRDKAVSEESLESLSEFLSDTRGLYPDASSREKSSGEAK